MRPGPRALAALGVLLAVAAVAVAAEGRVLLHQCLTADGPLGALGVRLAVLRSTVECPEGTLGLGTASQGAVLLLSVALPVVGAHLLLAAGGLGLGVVVRRGAAVVRALVASRLVPLVAVPAPALVPVRRAALVPAVGPPLVGRALDPARPHRGPPAV